jgi:hypothetical protein
MKLNSIAIAGMMIVCCVLGGCDSSGGVAGVPVTGTVTMDGAPLPNGSIVFLVASGDGTSVTAPIVDGKYKAVVPTGAKKVQIYGPPPGGGSTSMTDLSKPTGAPALHTETIPAKYNANTELQATIDSSGKPIDFSLSSK